MKLNTEEKVHYGPLAKGCKHCILGKESVLFITGKCHYKCFYCPISDDKRNKDIVKTNELIIKNPDSKEGLQSVITEIKTCSSTGVGITGGDPLSVMERTCRYIRALKKEFGKAFHIHLYTSLPFVTKKRLKELEETGLDELRFHVDIENKDSWKTLELAKDYLFSVGVEIPAFPNKIERTKKLLDYCKELSFVSFVNLNELEYSDVSETKLTEKAYMVKNNLSYGITKSEEAAKELVKYGASINLSVHYCSSSFKDRVQLGNRLLLRSATVALPLDIVDEQGILTRGEIRLDLVNENLLKVIQKELAKEFSIPEDLFYIEKERLLIASWVLEDIWKQVQFDENRFLWKKTAHAAIVKEYPTSDHFLLEKTLL